MKTSATQLGEVLILTLNSKDLLKSLTLVGKVVAANPIVPALENVKVEILPGKIQFTGSNLQQTVTSTVDYPLIGDTGVFLLPYKKTVDLLKTLPDVPVNIVYTAKEAVFTIQIEVDGKKFKMSSDAAKDYPKEQLFSGDSIELPVKQLKEALSICFSTVSTDTLRPAQLGVHFNMEPGEIVSCNGTNLTIYRTGLSLDLKPFTVPAEFARLVVDHLSDDEETVTLEISDNHVRFSNEAEVVTSVLIAEKFVEYTNAIPSENPWAGTINILEWSTAIKRSLIFTNSKSFSTKNTFSDGKLTISTQDEDYGYDSKQEIPFDGNFDLEIGMNGKNISQILQKLPSETARIEMSTPNRVVCIYPDNTLAEELLILSAPVML